MGVTDRRMWIAALVCSVALIGLALAPWLEGGGYKVDGSRLTLVLGISRAHILIAAAIAAAAISLVAIRRPNLQIHSAPILSIFALGAFVVCAWTVAADWRFFSCGFAFTGDGVNGNRICVDGSDIIWTNGAQATLSLWVASGLSAFLMLWSSARWFRLQRSLSKVNEVTNGWA